MESAGLEARCFGSAEEFLEPDQRNQTGCLVADIRMPGMSGLELQAKLKAEGSGIPIIFVTAHGDAQPGARPPARLLGHLQRDVVDGDDVVLAGARAI